MTKLSDDHNHEADDSRFINLMAVEKMKKAVIHAPDRGVKAVYGESIVSVVNEMRNAFDEEELGAALPKFRAVRGALHRERAAIRPNLPSDPGEIEFDDS